jgi:hypothetical protein
MLSKSVCTLFSCFYAFEVTLYFVLVFLQLLEPSRRFTLKADFGVHGGLIFPNLLQILSLYGIQFDCTVDT